MRVSLTTLALVAVTLATTAVAQIRFTSPRGFLSKEGVGMCHLMGALEYGRHDILDGELAAALPEPVQRTPSKSCR
jgi:hypothetical protein